MSSVSFNPISYIQGIVSATKPGKPAQTGSTSGSGNSSSSSDTNKPGLNTVVSLLQNTNASSSGGVLSTLLGDGTSSVPSSNPIAGVYNSLIASSTLTSPLNTALSNIQQQPHSNSVQSALNSYNGAINAYNQTLLQTAKSVASANNYGPGGTPLVA